MSDALGRIVEPVEPVEIRTSHSTLASSNWAWMAWTWPDDDSGPLGFGATKDEAVTMLKRLLDERT